MRAFARKFWISLLLLGIVAASALAGDLPRSKPEDVGLSPRRITRLDLQIEKHIMERKLAGAVVLLARRGKVAHLKAYGMADIEASRQMQPDTIFRIASMTKPITSIAVMMLYEEGHFRLRDPLHRFIPEFKDATVLPPLSQQDSRSIPAKGPITIRHLLTHTAGLTYHWNPRLGKRYRDAGITHGLLTDDGTLEEKMKVLAGIPLLFHPGERFEYSLSIDVLGRVVEVASGMTLAEFMRQRIFEPLGMKDTHFFLSPERVPRLAAVYSSKPGEPIERVGEDPIPEAEGMMYAASHPYRGRKQYYAGGGGLVSTAADYFRFCQMVLNNGVLDGARLLSPKTVELISQDHLESMLGDEAPAGFGLGFSVVRNERDLVELGSVGSIAWGGFWYTTFFIDPSEEFIGIFMAQLHPAGGLDLKEKFENLAYQAIVE